MNQQEQATKRAAIFQDTINGINDPTPWPVTMWATSRDTIWTAGTATTEGEDSVGRLYMPGDLIVHRSELDGDTTRTTGSFAIMDKGDKNPMAAMLDGITQWDQRRAVQWDTVPTPGAYRMTDPASGQPLPMGWSDSLAAAASAAGMLDPELLQASLMQYALEHEPRPCVFFQEDNGYDLMVISWHQNEQGLYDGTSFKHLQYDDLAMQVTTIAHTEGMEQFPAKTMSDGELLTQSRVYRDRYQAQREHDGGPAAQGMTGRVMRAGLLKPGIEQKPLLTLADGRKAPDWDEYTESTAVGILQGRAPARTPSRGTPGRHVERPANPPQDTKPRGRDWPNVWIANRLAHTYVLHAKDGRDWRKMIVSLPAGTTIDGQDLSGWATDMFMSDKNMTQKQEGRAVNVRFRPDTPVDLFTGRGADRRSMQVDPRTLAQAIIDAQILNKNAEETIDAASADLAARTSEESGPQVDRMRDRFAEYQAAGTFRPSVALKWARRLIDRTAETQDGQWTKRQRRQAARLLVQQLTSPETPAEGRTATVDGASAPPDEKTPEPPADGPRRTIAPAEVPTPRAAGTPTPDSPEPRAADRGETREDTGRLDAKSTLDRFKTRLNENLAARDAPARNGIDGRGLAQPVGKKTL